MHWSDRHITETLHIARNKLPLQDKTSYSKWDRYISNILLTKHRYNNHDDFHIPYQTNSRVGCFWCFRWNVYVFTNGSTVWRNILTKLQNVKWNADTKNACWCNIFRLPGAVSKYLHPSRSNAALFNSCLQYYCFINTIVAGYEKSNKQYSRVVNAQFKTIYSLFIRRMKWNNFLFYFNPFLTITEKWYVRNCHYVR